MTNDTTANTLSSPCVHADRCGGCSYQGVSYDEQLSIKQKLVEELLAKAGMDPKLAGSIEPSPVLYRYRNKMEYTFGNEYKDDPLTLGLHKQKSFMSVVHTGACQIVPEAFKIGRASCRERV